MPDAKIPKTIDNDVLTNVSETSAVASVNDENQNTNNNRKVIKSDQNDEKYVQRQPSRTVIIEVCDSILISICIPNYFLFLVTHTHTHTHFILFLFLLSKNST